MTMSELNGQVSDVKSVKSTDETSRVDGPAPCDVIQEVNKPDKDAEATSADDVLATSETQNTIKRSVSFPSSGAPVLGYLEPPDPWRDVPPWNSQDLVAAYRKGCEQYGVRPLNKVIQQIQAIENVGQRYETLSLKGEKLDIRHCESLEEIFRRVQFRTIDLEACHLDDETSVALFDMIEYYESACKVNISFNKNISFRGWQSCARLIRKTPSLTFLDARNCDINERVMPIIGRSLRMGCFLTTLHLENTALSGRPLIILVAALKMNEILKELFLADNKLFPTDGIQLGNLLKYNHKLQLLDIRNNHLQDVGVGHVCDGVYEQNLGSGLLTLVLWNNQISYQSMSALSKALSSTESLETLNLGHNNVTNEGIHLLKDGLLKSKSLLRIGLQGTKITCEGAVALAEAIADSPRLLRLDLRENDIKTAGLMALSLALKVNDTVIRLDLDKDTKRDSGMKDYAEQQRRLQQDINTYLERNVQLSRQKDEEERINLERKIKEEQSKLESENLGSTEQVDVKDIPVLHTFDKIKRPRLLVMPEVPAEQKLDSPCYLNENLTASLTEIKTTTPNLLKNIPPGELLLSPQYCPQVKAKKLFTVSQVLSPTSPLAVPSKGGDLAASSVSFQPLILSPNLVDSVVSQSDTSLSHYVMPSNSDLTGSLTSENVNNLLEKMMIDKVSSESTSLIDSESECNRNSDWSGKIAIDQSEIDGKTVTDQQDSSLGTKNLLDSNEDVAVDKTEASKKVLDKSENNKASVSRGKFEISTDTTELEENLDGDFLADINDDSDDVFIENLQFEPVEEDTKKQEKVLTDSVLDKPEQNAKHIDCSSTDSSKCANFDETKFQSENNSENVIGDKLTVNIKCSSAKEVDQKDSGIGSYENEHWTKIETSEYRTGNGAINDTGKPNFHTTLTMNGLTQELASVLENLDGEGTQTAADSEILTPPDEFERELDEMLANVKTGSNIPSTSEVSLNISSLSKTPEEILKEALESSSTSIPVTE